MKNSSLLVSVFFGLLFFGIFLGDGKQAVIEVFGVASTLVFLVYCLLQKLPLVALPARLSRVWMVFFVSVFLSTLASSSVALSISWFVRLLCGYLVYRIFFSMATEHVRRVFIFRIFFFMFLVGVVWCVSIMFPRFYEALPTMNLVDVRYGHSHIADLLVFVTPAVFWMVVNGSIVIWARVLLLGAYLVAILATQSRGAWVIAFAFIFIKAIRSRYRKIFTISLFVVVLLIIINASFFKISPTGPKYTGKVFLWVDRVVHRPTFFSRLEYWRQSIQAFQERPILGSGPGTFSLVSVRLQKETGLSSWFAHSAPLQMASDLGLLGIISFTSLVVAHVLEWKSKLPLLKYNRSPLQALSWMIALILLYSMFEFVLDYFIIWLLVWAGVGLCVGSSRLVHRDAQVRAEQANV